MRLSIKKLLPFLFAILIPATAFADNQPIRNENQATLRDLGSELTVGSNYAVDRRGNIFTRVTDPSSGLTQSVVPVSPDENYNGSVVAPVAYFTVGSDAIEADSTTTVLNLTSHVARVGDMIKYRTATGSNQGTYTPVCSTTTNTVTLCKALPTTPGTDSILIVRPVNLAAFGLESGTNGYSLVTSLDVNYQNTAAGGILKQEDAAHTSGDAGVAALSVVNATANASVLGTTQLDYGVIATNTQGAVQINLSSNFADDPNTSPLRAEDGTIANAKTLMMSGGQALSAIAQSVDASGDAAPPSMDLGNRLVTTNAPAGETWWACTGEITTATNTQIKASVASNRHYITAFSCAATSTSPNQIYLTDGSGGTAMDFVNTTSNAVAPGPQNTYPTPLRGSSATGVFVTTITTGGVRCCASGYISTI